jgi:hypothetical protein
MLAFIGLLFAITQIGAPFLIVIWGGAAWWLFGHKHQAWVIVVWGLFVSSIDNLIKALAHRLLRADAFVAYDIGVFRGALSRSAFLACLSARRCSPSFALYYRHGEPPLGTASIEP